MTSYLAHLCVILAIDPGRVSGWSVWCEGYYVASGTARSLEDRRAAIAESKRAVTTSGRRLVVVGEIWTPGGRFAGARTMQGIGSAWGEWLAALDLEDIPKSRRIRAKVQTWRAAFTTGRRMSSADWDRHLAGAASALAGRPITDDNEADAVCIGRWATHADPVAKLLAPRTPKKTTSPKRK